MKKHLFRLVSKTIWSRRYILRPVNIVSPNRRTRRRRRRSVVDVVCKMRRLQIASKHEFYTVNASAIDVARQRAPQAPIYSTTF